MDSDFAARSVHSSEWACWLSVRCCSSDGQGLAYLCCKSASGHSAARVVDNLSAGCLSQEFVGRGDMTRRKFHDICYIVTPCIRLFRFVSKQAIDWAANVMMTVFSRFWSIDAG
jgi:hypothetical protein